MGGSMSSSSLYRIVATVEIVTSLVISSFGINTFLLFQQQNDKFQVEKEMILYSSIVAVVQSFLSILASVLLVGCHRNPLPSPQYHHASGSEENGEQHMPPPPPLPQNARISGKNSLRRKALAPTWISWTLISIACLLFVFIAPIHYCIQADTDLEKLSQFTMREGFYESLDNKRVGLCYSVAPELEPIRNSLRDLYSFSFIGIMFKVIFVLMMQRNWKKEQERVKKVIIYVEGAGGVAEPDYEDDYNPRNTPTEPKIIVSSCSTSSAGGVGYGTEVESRAK